ncbi:hypothetical protein HNQ08_005410 [Deinococcus humi]|uniref:Uncharacterized protein n=1 Tax=Deinococcus humi TaxID=662880 RepID=A0A7W8K2F4_9DEIO|nr:hypothetical protein [Deinococcus humi]GGO41153.1 hypothetical protein GCM10008949_51560 [Deinococcus humi]
MPALLLSKDIYVWRAESLQHDHAAALRGWQPRILSVTSVGLRSVLSIC